MGEYYDDKHADREQKLEIEESVEPYEDSDEATEHRMVAELAEFDRSEAREKLNLVYVNHNGSRSTSDWVYYRVAGSTKAGGTLETCRVSFPEFRDRESPVSTPGIVGYDSVPDHMQKLIMNKWGIDHATSLLIGILPLD